MPHILVPFLMVAIFSTFACATAEPARPDSLHSKSPAIATPDDHRWKPNFRPKDTLTQAFEHHPNWIGQNLQFAPFDKLRLQLEKYLGRHLQNRGEAHITVVTPPEFESLKKCLSIDDIEVFLDRKALQDATYVPECIGRGSLGAPPFRQETYFVVVTAPALTGLRKKLETAAAAKGCTDFKASPYYPHVTLGFDQRDLHEADGVRKDTRSCAHPLHVL